ncbi:uncharacterized protein N7500_004283 [Penicillium coprophilum]|uniref:uncharacterized protein n=1 Tax=Penicillium coprophilum TaxID=36646 RepID=UPI00238732B4|nr:uncharacterized protein N7500_004283 [Penicillium coprophilum]KAJ5171500.1 hypothetical protein N7500_004283 [Penicillium coprophilum]
MVSVFAPAWDEFIQEIGPLLMTGSTVEDLYKDSEINSQKIISRYKIPPLDDSVTAEDIKLENAWVRVFTPPSATGDGPVGIFIHGGGWIMGSVDIEDAACRHISTSTGMKVVSIGYRLAPEFQFPHSLNDCVEATLWTLNHFAISSVILMGGSAGASLAFGVALKLVDSGLGDKVRGILALVPCTVHPDAVPDDKKESFTSYQEHAMHTVNTLPAMKCFLDSYGPSPDDKYFSVLLHPRLKDLKKVYIVECGTDTLRDDARLMKGALEEAGVPIMYDDYPGYPHYFWSYPSPALAQASEVFHTNMFRAIKWINLD